ncbi:MAG: pectin esterase [Muribaculaceae bacterium]|nr:pectin esterase [Muribaculaceae bacterium]
MNFTKPIITLCLAALLPMGAGAVTIRSIGDSTMATKKLDGQNPERGWCHVLPGFFTEDVVVDNHAVNGRSTKTFLSEGRWDVVMDSIRPGDYVFIQFGHNDASDKGERATVAGGDFDENLRRYVRDTRSKGGIPVLFTPIARRKFMKGELVDTHGKYVQSVKDVAKELDVVCIDLNASTTDWIKDLGDEASKPYFMHIPAGTVPLHPDGKKDNTHLNVAGARVVAGMAADSIAARIPELGGYVRHYDFVVAKDGSGDFFTVQQAVDAVPDYRNARTTILVRDGVYNEKIVVPQSKTNLSLLGQGKVKLTFDNRASRLNACGDEMGTPGSASTFIYPDNFYCENITFENPSGVTAGQAVACLTGGDKMFFKNCRFLGFQDTLYAYGLGRQYYEDCYIEGSVDFIFGPATALFNRCEIRNNREKGYITAPSTPQYRPYGFVFMDCKLTSEDGCDRCWLSRPWKEYGKTVFVRCEIGDHIRPEGWHNWRKPEREKTSYYAEYGCTGPGADTSKRAFGYVLDTDADYTIDKILSGWNPTAEK